MSAAAAAEREPKVGGPVDPQENLYISRSADQEFLELLRAGEYVNIITSRQMGKTSLVYRAIADLTPQGVKFAYFDLSRLRNEQQARRYFRTLLVEIGRELQLDVDLAGFWAQGEPKANGQLFVDFFRLALGALEGPVVVVLDEIDSTLESAQLGYTDDLFTAIRSLYTIRPREPLFKRLSFCLVGVATPNELIKARRTTPYNIGRTIWLADFDPRRDDLTPLARILSDDATRAQPLLARVLYWTGGQPYLTMWMCDELRRKGALDPAAVDELVEQTFTTLERLRGDAHFDQTQRFLNERAGGGAEELGLYERILRGAREADRPANPTCSHLKLAGLVRRDENGVLVVRNPIYARLFDLDWVARSRPRAELRKARRLALGAVALLVLGSAGFLFYYQTGVVPLKQQEGARGALKDLGVEVAPFDDYSGRTVVGLGSRSGDRDVQALLQAAAPHLGSIDAGDPSKGLSLDLASAPIFDLTPLAGLRNLRSLNVSATRVSDLEPLSGLPGLEELDISRTSVANLAPLSRLPALEALDASATQVSDLRPLAQVQSLKRLDVSRTAVADLTPLAGLDRLEYLNVAWTKVTNLAPLEGLTELRILEIDGLGIGGFDVGGRIQKLRIFGAGEDRKPAAPSQPGQSFRDCEQCPEMVVVPAGSFEMGSRDNEPGRLPHEGPRHKVDVVRPLAVGKFEVAFDEWDACVAAGGCSHQPDDEGWGRGRRPVINVSWEDAQEYVRWLSKKTGKEYRLLSEAEWEHVARAGSATRYPWGDEPGSNRANFYNSGTQWSGKQTAPVGSFEPNDFGLHDMIGNVWEWTEDCYRGSYEGAPADGRPWYSAICGLRAVHGGSWMSFLMDTRSANRNSFQPGIRINNLGFRLARTLERS
jgi:formylglycine-generating enzyme required for sulfatase activity